jgi:hypothetical protein
MVEPRYQVFFERDRYVNVHGRTNLKQMRLTLGTSLLFTDHGAMGVSGEWLTRSPVFAGQDSIEDYYDEFAVEDSCYGPWNTHFPKDSISVNYVDFVEDTLFSAMHYLGAPLDHAKIYYPHYYTCSDDTCYDLAYREFDHGLVVVHYGLCAAIGGGDYGEGSDPDTLGPDSAYKWVLVDLDEMELENDPRDIGMHFMGIGGCDYNSYQNKYNDFTNRRQHPVEGFFIYLYGDGRILLKEGDGFDALHPLPGD